MSFKTLHYFILYLYILKATKDRTLLNIKVFLLQYAGKPIIIINFPNNIYFSAIRYFLPNGVRYTGTTIKN